ncbi:hypothetical protein [Devosia neptuniae]|jgi:hypothetical protein|uniref:hypothetical protein n=1 Tax=Devosia TaxID=46913 RepID=UPI0022AF1609|nr:hypothetical protein [Devosia neptuniae]MCZ4344520.1 hypothetical protein [Devosia neptuniae]|tara:strand:- start:2198 stop:3574 length:1377 start_codon:yes stop_codon:yes gene_type:complete
MKSIVTINASLPTVEDRLEYFSGASLRDYDIALFDPTLPYLSRIEFSGGGSCIDIESTKRLNAAMKHWATEIRGALSAGKTIFVPLAEYEEDSGAIGYEVGTRNRRSYNTHSLHNYQALPFPLSVRNTKGRQITVADGMFRGLFDTLKEVASYRVILDQSAGQPVFAAKDGAAVGSVLKPQGVLGHLVLLPYFNMIEHDTADPEMWSDEAERLSHGIVAQLIAVDRSLRAEGALTPPPKWLASAPVPKQVGVVSKEVARIEAEIGLLEGNKEEKLAEAGALMAHSRLLFETGKPLEAAIEAALQLLGFTVENYRAGDVEIDHIFVGPSGIRMIGESEGKENSSVDINKFRQLESNINEDFQREEVTAPAKGVLFGNAYRFTEPALRADHFTAKCLTNAKRLGTALVRTSDLYDAIVFVLDHPNDHRFVERCRIAIEETSGSIVVFPVPLDNRLAGQSE